MKNLTAIFVVTVLMALTISSAGCAKKPAEFVFSDLTLNPAEAQVFQEVTATASVKNNGQLEGICKTVLKINGAEMQTRDIPLKGGTNNTVSFTFKRDAGPRCDVEINGLSKTLVVKEGILPVLSIGDKWTVKWKIDVFEYNVTMEVMGEDITDGKNCYVMQATFEPAFQGIVTSANIKYEKATMQEVRMQMSGKVQDQTFVSATAYSHTLSGSPLYPITVGTENKVVTTETQTITVAGQKQTQTNTHTVISKVEKIEDVILPAGTFRCFKIVRYDEQGKVLSTSWACDKTKIDIKNVESGANGLTVELVSYNIH